MMKSLSDMFNENAKGMTALHHAVRNNHPDIAKELLRRGARPDRRKGREPKTAAAPPASKAIKIMKPLKLKRRDGRSQG